MREMAAAVDAFRNEVMATLEGLDMDIRRALEWIHGERREHWNHEVRRGWDRITQAQIQLQQARTVRRVGDHEPACPDEKKALERAKRRLETAQAKVEAVRHAARAIDETVNDYRGAKTPLVSWLESDALKAIAALSRMMDNLETYVAMEMPAAAAIPPEGQRSDAASTQYSVPSSQVEQPKADGKTAQSASTQYSLPSSPDEPSQADREMAEAPGIEYCVLGTGGLATGADQPPQSADSEIPVSLPGGPA